MDIKFTPQMTISQLEKLFPTDDACKQYLVARRWPKGVHCPRCDNENVHPVRNEPFRWQCTQCVEQGGYRFSVMVGTIFENTNIGLSRWFKVIYLMLASKSGISATQIQRIMGFGSYSTANYMYHRIRVGLADRQFRKLMGIVEDSVVKYRISALGSGAMTASSGRRRGALRLEQDAPPMV
jgi:transposase-like protein